jgi:hypothetical protein
MAFNASKYKREWSTFVEAFRNAPPATHKSGALANKFVFACQASPYIAGHLLLVAAVLCVVAVVAIK